MHGLVRDWNLGVWSAVIPWATGWAHVLSGRGAEAAESLEQALATREKLGFEDRQPLVLVHAAEACLAADRSRDARGYAERALALARERGERGHEAYALRVLAEIIALRHLAETETAAAHYDAAIALATELGMRPLVARCHAGLATLCRRAGDGQRARQTTPQPG
jgi:tetratricopeptide (TPR) repeat protein